jgi:hypothetical protein
VTAAPIEGPGRIRPFADVLNDMRRGEVLDRAAVELQDLVRAVATHGKKGKLVLTIDVAPMKGDSNALVVGAQVKTTPPIGGPAEAVFFADTDHNLVRDDPRQIALPGLRRVDLPANNEPKDIAK